MILPDNRTLRATADERLRAAPAVPGITLLYALIILGFSAATLIIQFLVDSRLSRLGGLSNLGARSVLSTVSQVLPIMQSVLTMGLNLGFLGVMLRTARGLNVNRETLLKAGFERFSPLLWSVLIRGLTYVAMLMGSLYAAVLVYSYSPLSRNLNEALEPLASAAVSTEELVTNPAVFEALRGAVPLLTAMTLLIFLVFGLPVIYSYRMTEYIILDSPKLGARYALRKSRCMMRGVRRQLLRVDLGFWWYFVLSVLAAILCYGDEVLALLGVELPISATVQFFGFYALYVVCQLVIYYFFKAKVSQVYALIYDSMIQEEKAGQQAAAVVLGSIFQK